MAQGKIGTLQQVNGTTVMIDGVFYDGGKVANYLPQTAGIQVEFNATEGNQLLFIKEKKAYTGPRKAYTPKNMAPATQSPAAPAPIATAPTNMAPAANMAKPAYTPKTDWGKNTESIIRQVVFKAAVEIVNSFSYSSVEEKMAMLDKVYQDLVAKYADILK
jgi:hypothetical protein